MMPKFSFAYEETNQSFGISEDIQIMQSFEDYNCHQHEWISILVPFRNREQHLPRFIDGITKHLHINGQRNYEILLIEQVDTFQFNRAKLLNVGAKMARLNYQAKCLAMENLCLIPHDIDMIPLMPSLQYDCINSPKLLATAAQQFGFRMPYDQYFGGVIALTWSQFESVNGFSNKYWGWGGEDDDIWQRIGHVGLEIYKENSTLGRFQVSEIVF